MSNRQKAPVPFCKRCNDTGWVENPMIDHIYGVEPCCDPPELTLIEIIKQKKALRWREHMERLAAKFARWFQGPWKRAARVFEKEATMSGGKIEVTT
jgi:hypothetical protein